MALKESSLDTLPRVMRVFISSTFRDMQAERDILVKRVFPQLRKLCEQRGVTWDEVDLRWGITDEQSADGQVLPICLAEIQNCRPYFIGLLGERYGWVPASVADELVEQEPWLAEHRGRSVTELEILHGVLNDPGLAQHAYFYFRDPAYVDRLPATERAEFREAPTQEEISAFGTQEAHRRADARRQKLNLLKARIRSSGFPLKESYRDPESLGEMVLQDMTGLIDRLFPEGEQPGALDREAAGHEAFAASRAKVYIGRQEYFRTLDQHANGAGNPLVVLGESGAGKSALLANWAIGYRKSHPGIPVLMHFIGSSPYSSDWVAMLRRIMGELKRHFDFQEDIPDKPDALRAAFANWLHMAAAKGRVVLILDALNQLEDREGAPDLVWLPPQIPANVRLILSTLPGRALEELKKRAWQTLQVKPLEVEERKKLIGDYLAQYKKTLSPQRIARIASAPQAANPLFLRALLEELRVFGIHELLDERIDRYLKATTINSLYEMILERYEQDYESKRPGLVKEAMSLIGSARRGLTEAELLDLLGSGGSPMPRAWWTPLFLAAEQGLVSRSGLIGFAHDFLRQAVTARYLSTEKDRRESHSRLAHYFNIPPIRPRKIDELPWQLMQAGNWPALYGLLTDLQFFKTSWEMDAFEVKAYWAQLEANSNFQMVSGYQQVLEKPGNFADLAWQIGQLLGDTGHSKETLSLREYLLEHYRKIGDWQNVPAALANLAVTRLELGDLDRSMALYKQAEQLCRKFGDKERLQNNLRNQADILFQRGNLDRAIVLYHEAERLCRELGNRAGLMRSLGSQASILYATGDLEHAMELYAETERLCREQGDRDGLQATLGNQATLLTSRGDLDKAMALYHESESICRELGDKDGLQNGLGHQAHIYYLRGEPDAAWRLLKEQERICREIGSKRGLSDSLDRQAKILFDRGDPGRAMALLNEEERLCRDLADKDGLQACLGEQANILYRQGDDDGAFELNKERERLCRELGNKAGLQACLGGQANILYDRGDLDKAMELHKEAESLCREINDIEGLGVSLGNQALILAQRGRLREALALHKEEERICRELGDRYGLSCSLLNQSIIIGIRMYEPEKALPLVEEAHRLAKASGYVRLVNEIAAIRAKIYESLG